MEPLETTEPLTFRGSDFIALGFTLGGEIFKISLDDF